MMNDQPQQEVEPQPQPQEEPEPEPQPQPQSRKKRTATRLIDHKEPHEVDFNNIGQHVGKKQIGRKCQLLKKDMLWSTIKKRWNIPNDNRKKDVLRTCNSQWRAFKKRLKKKCDNQRDPLETYSYLERSTLQSFRQRISSEEFQEISEKARIKSERSLHYVMGRRSKNELGSNIIPPTIQPPIVDKLVDVQTQISEGDLELSPGEDLLTNVIGPEHPGRTRAVGHDETIDLMGSQLEKLQAHFDLQQGSRNHAPDNVSLGVQQNNCGSTPTLDALDAIKMPTPCELVLPYGELDQKCAKGLVFPFGNGGGWHCNSMTPACNYSCKGTKREETNSNHKFADSGILEVGTYDFSVTCEEYFRLLRKQTTDASIITAWQLILHSMVRTRMNKCAFLNPYNILGEACQKNPEGVVSYLVDSIRLHHGKLFLIAPYLQHKHWVLLVISLRNRVVYILDSLKNRIEKSADYHYLLKKHVDMAFMRYEKDTSTPIGWIFAECNQQLGGLESGHYVM
ncbi:unnamed protein product [Lactuca virosa]|uniref:Ubiquitin-like protease family profile domain-containing protein n=1 Tax=Lactuca virosa TaxID=75947 RepID=A0AAU9PI68_9ASTR|nr:unnamed protein product [Lactuca virosa]